MRALLATVALVGVALGGEANCFKSKPEAGGPVREVDVDGLSEYLVGKVRTEDSEANLEQLRRHSDSLSRPMRKAAELALEVSQVAGGQCNEQLLALIERAAAAELKANHSRRLDKVISGQLISLMDTCERYIQEEYVRLSAGDEQLVSLISALKCKGKCHAGTLAHLMKSLASKQDNALADCGELAKSNKKRSQPFKVIDESKFKAALNRYLIEPCDQFNFKLADKLIGPLQSIRDIYGPSARYYDMLKGKLGSPLVTLRLCRQVAAINEDDRDYMARKFCF